ncbi:MAG: methyltransferase [Bacteroidetes bacterium]|nr:methyltransferase [Bacteroidota bacterium]
MKMNNEPEISSYPPLHFVRITEKIRHFFLRMNRRFTHPNLVMWEMAHNMWLAAGVSVAAELGIADLVKEGPRSIDELAELTSTHSESLYRVMRMLASHDVFREVKGRSFEISPLAVPLQDDQIRYLILLHLNRNHFRMFGDLIHSVRTGDTVSGEHSGKALFDHIGSEDKRNEWFNKAMTSASKMQVPALLSAFPFKKFGNIIDIGGGEGLLLATVLSKAPKSRGLVFDLPNVLLNTEDIIARYSLSGRMEALEGDFFESVPAGGDLYMLKSVLHDWDDDSSVRILRNVHKAMDQLSRLLVIEAVLDEGNQPSFGKMSDILMMAAAGGKERTRAQWLTLLETSGFRIRRIHPTISPHSLIEAVKI